MIIRHNNITNCNSSYVRNVLNTICNSSFILFCQIADAVFTPAVKGLQGKNVSEVIVNALVIVVSTQKIGLVLPEGDWQTVCRTLLLPAQHEKKLLERVNSHFQDKQ